MSLLNSPMFAIIIEAQLMHCRYLSIGEREFQETSFPTAVRCFDYQDRQRAEPLGIGTRATMIRHELSE